MNSILLTGFPGFISKHYLNELLLHSEPEEIHFLVLPSMKELARNKTNTFKRKFPKKNFYIHEGDITKEGLALKEDFEVQSVHHLAAIYDLAVSPEIAHLVNVQGTENVINWVKSKTEIKQIVYFSTCYVLGRGSVLTENFIDHPKGFSEFNNHYEHTKWEAEECFREVENALIIRPSVVVGNSETGVTEKEDGPYFVINFLKKLGSLSLLCPNLGRKDIIVNTVPVDTLCKISVSWIHEHEKLGFPQKIINAADPNPPTTWDYYSKVISTLTGRTPYKLNLIRGVILFLLRLPGVHHLTGIKPTTLDYFSWKGKIETKSVKSGEFPLMLEHLPKTIYPNR